MNAVLSPRHYGELRAMARRLMRGRHDADDLFHDALIVAMRAGRLDDPAAPAWLGGVMRNLATAQARSAVRRRRREERFAFLPGASDDLHGFPPDFLDGLPAGLRIVALLADCGATRAEIRHLLRLNDTALRQRISALRRRWAAFDDGNHAGYRRPEQPLALGSIRRALLRFARRAPVHLASHDPDGHLIAFGKIARPPHKTLLGGN